MGEFWDDGFRYGVVYKDKLPISQEMESLSDFISMQITVGLLNGKLSQGRMHEH